MRLHEPKLVEAFVIGRLHGRVVERDLEGHIVLDVQGVGYDLAVPLLALGVLGEGAEVTLHVHTNVREDAIALFGFLTLEDRAAFRVLLGVSSVGPKLAMAVLSHLDAKGLAAALAREDRKVLQSIPGVGKKLVDRLLLELKDKLGFVSVSASSPGIASAPVVRAAGPLGHVSAILVSMGFRPVEAERAVAALSPSAEGKPADVLVREALALLA